MVTDEKDFWNKKANSAKWQDYILPGRTPKEFESEGALQALEFSNLIHENSIVIDYGCGIGRVTRYLKLWCYKAIGLDLCDTYIEKARLRNIGISDLEFYTLREFEHETKVANFIVCIMVMQHNSAKNRKLIIDHIYKLLNTSGTALISFPKESSKIYKETPFVHKFSFKEVQEYGKMFKSFSITSDNLIHYKNASYSESLNEYFLKVIK